MTDLEADDLIGRWVLAQEVPDPVTQPRAPQPPAFALDLQPPKYKLHNWYRDGLVVGWFMANGYRYIVTAWATPGGFTSSSVIGHSNTWPHKNIALGLAPPNATFWWDHDLSRFGIDPSQRSTKGTWIGFTMPPLPPSYPTLPPRVNNFVQAAPKTASNWPHKCPACGSPALTLFVSTDCSSRSCRNHQGGSR